LRIVGPIAALFGVNPVFGTAAGDRLGLMRRNRSAQRFSPARCAFLARQNRRACRSSTFVPAPAGCAAPDLRRSDHNKDAMGADLQPQRSFIMALIGTFTAQDNGFTGTVRTLTLNVKVKIVPSEKESDKAPDYRIVAGAFEIGAAWKKVSNNDRPYLSVTLDDPSFPATIYARLVENEDGTHSLIWSRPKGN
jgi:uncharacterized protein (DUF736 family)